MDLKKIGLLLGPLLFIVLRWMPAPEALSSEAWRVIALAALMLAWWITEAVPIAVTALVPIIGLPFLGISDMKKAAAPYADPVVFLFMGGFMIALAMEKWKLHRRIALNIVRITGTNANGIILGFMIATAFLSMWISNTATTVMMLPIALSVIDLLTRGEVEYPRADVRNFALCMMLVTAYGANIGGTITLIGTPPNVVFAGIMRDSFQQEVSFASWILMAAPFGLVLLALTFLTLTRLMYPNKLGRFSGGRELIRTELSKLGRPSGGERRVLFVFLLTALAWIFRPQLNALAGLKLSDPEIAIWATVILFIIPVNFKENQFVLTWEDTVRLPWGILLLFGGGLSLAGALQDTGIIDLIGSQFSHLHTSGFWIILGLTAVSLFMTEVMSNVALVTILVPVVGAIALGVGLNPLLPSIPVTLAASCAFMLPMSTPPNAIVFASGHVTIPQMMRAGILLNLISIILIAILSSTLIPMIFS